MKSIIRIMWIVSVLLMISLQVGVAQESTPEAEDAEALFIGEDCTRHCWFDLLTSDNTSEEVHEWLLTSENVSRVDGMTIDEYIVEGERDPETNILINGQYEFLLLPDPIRTYYDVSYTRLLILIITSSIEIESGVIAESFIDTWDWIHISDVLEVLGNPDLIRFDYDDFATVANLEFIYIERRLRLAFQHFRPDIQPSSEFNCDIPSFLERSWLSSIRYYSPERALESVSNLQGEDAPRLVIYYVGDSDVPFDTWETWLTMDETMPCDEAYYNLPTERVYPDLSVLEAMLDFPPAP